MNRGLSYDYLVPWSKNPGNRTDRRHKFNHDEAVEAGQLSGYSRGGKCVSRALEDAFGMQKPPRKPVLTMTYQGETLSVGKWAKLKGLNYQTLRQRILHGWPPELALETPVSKENPWLIRRMKKGQQ